MIACVAMPFSHLLKRGNPEGGGLAGAGAGLAEDVDAGQRAGDQQRLDLGGRDEFRFGQGAEDGRSNAECGESFGKGGMFGFVAQYLLSV